MTDHHCNLTDDAHAALWGNILTAASHLGRWEAFSVQRRPPVVQLKAGAAETPIYFIGAGLSEFRLAELIDSSNPIFTIEVPWPSTWHKAATNNDIRALPTLEQLVAPYVTALRAHSRSRSCIIAGFSFCGLMAFEAAHQLQALGRTVEIVILLDAPARYPAAHEIAWEKLQNEWKRTRSKDRTSNSIIPRLRVSCAIVWWMLVTKMNGLLQRLKSAAGQDHDDISMKFDDKGTPIRWGLIQRLYANALKSYHLRCLESRAVLFKTEVSNVMPNRILDGSLGWADLFNDGLEVVQVKGDHVTMLQQPHVLGLAQEVGKVLESPSATSEVCLCAGFPDFQRKSSALKSSEPARTALYTAKI
jgi:thioesterase domain-containing protein